MSLVGDIIMDMRTRIPDAPPVGAVPLISLAQVYDPLATGLIPGLGYFFVGTQFNAWGESLPSAEATVILTPPNNAIQVNFNNVGYPVRVYWGNNPGVEVNSFENPPGYNLPTGGGDQLILGRSGPAPGVYYVFASNQARPPTRNTLFLPDSDGNFIGSYTAFRLLNRAISEMVKIAGGVIDVTGVQTQVNQSMYRIDTPAGQGSFYTFTNAWFDGYPMDIVQRSMMYLRNSAAGFSGILSYEQDGPSSVIQVWPQSNRTGGSSILVQNMTATQNNFGVANGTGFLSIGLAQIDNEIVAFSQVTNESGLSLFQGVTRGLGGTVPVSHQQDAPVTELNLRLSGYRMPPLYSPGDAQLQLLVPQAWETPLVLHMLSQVRSMEQDDATAKSLQGDFVQMAEKIAKGSRLGKLKPRQIPIWGQNVSDARNVNGIGFGWLIN